MLRFGFIFAGLFLLQGCFVSEPGFYKELNLAADSWKAQDARLEAPPLLQTFSSCDSLESSIKEHLKEQKRFEILQEKVQFPYWRYRGRDSADGVKSAPGSAVELGAGLVEGVDYSGTNNQELGVDEADILKTDGRFIYVLNGNFIEITSVPEFGQINYVSKTKIEGQPAAMLVFDNKAAVFSNVYAESAARNRIKITLFAMSDNRETLQITRELYLDGNYQTARKIGTQLFMASHFESNDFQSLQFKSVQRILLDNPAVDWFDEEALLRDAYTARVLAITHNNSLIDGLPAATFMPELFEKSGGKLSTVSIFSGNCDNFSMAKNANGAGFLTLATLDLASTSPDVKTEHILGNTPVVYASKDTFVLASPNEVSNFWGKRSFLQHSNIHRFVLQADGRTKYQGSEKVLGTVKDQFSMSAYDKHIRVATTQFDGWRPIENHLYVLGGDESLKVTGHIGNIAPGEKLWSSRFVGEKGYLVTFKQTDPLFTLDLSNPSNPKIIGELKVPGVSTYIHPLDGNALLTVGYGGDEEGLDWLTRAALFDVSDYANPKLQSGLTVDRDAAQNPGSFSSRDNEANVDHKAITYWAKSKLLAVPYSREEWQSYGYSKTTSRLAIIYASADEPLKRMGDIDHSFMYINHLSQIRDISPIYPNRGNAIRRSIFMGDYVYAMSRKGITVHRPLDFMQVDFAALTGAPDY